MKDGKIVRLLDASACVECLFAGRAVTEFPDGSRKVMFHCRRLDCDNWITIPSENVSIDKKY